MDSNQSLTHSKDLSGTTLAGRYSVLSKLGEGGMASVYMGRDEVLDRPVAIKTVPRTNLSEVKLLRFQQEARTASTISHPNLIQMLDFGVLDSGRPYMVMELIDGVALDELITKHGPLRIEIVLDVIDQIATGMSAVHKGGIVHRDLKASNIMLVDVGTKKPLVKILDFGIAKSLASETQVSTLTKAGQILGSPHYMSPEQARGEELDQRSDIYSLGCIAYQLLTALQLFDGDTVMEVVTKHMSEPPPAVSAMLGKENVPPKVDELVARMVAKSPEDRFQSMEAVSFFVNELESSIISTAEDDVSNKDLLAGPKKISKRCVLVACLGLTALILTGAAGLYYAWYYTHREVAVKKKADEELLVPSGKLFGPIMKKWDDYTRDKILLHGTSPTGRLKETIKEHRVIRHVSVTDGSISDEDAKLIVLLKPRSVNFGGSSGVSDTTLKILSEAPSIQDCDFSLSRGITPKGVGYLSKLPALSDVSMKNCDLTDDHLKAMANIKKLSYCNFSKNKNITLKGLKYLSRKPYVVKVIANEGALSVLPSSKKKEIFDQYKIRLLDKDKSTESDAKMYSEMIGQDDELVPLFSPGEFKKGRPATP